MKIYGNTTWHNPTSETLTIRLQLDHGKGIFDGNKTVWKENAEFADIIFAPDQTKELPSEFDRFLVQEFEGKIIGGLAPMLQKVNSPNLPLPDAFNYEMIKTNLLIEETKQRLEKEKVMREIMEAKVVLDLADQDLNIKAKKSLKS